MKHVLQIAAVTVLIVLCTFLPFLPGRYDGLTVALSTMAQMVGTAGLVLVPVGALWQAAERIPRLARWRNAVALLALAMCSLVWILIALAATVQSGFTLGFFVLGLWGYAAWRAWPRLKRSRGVVSKRSSAFPLYLVVVPIMVAALQFALVERATDFSRSRAIGNSRPLIEAIELHRTTRGRYPASLLSVNPDYWPGVMGIAKYHYELNGQSYNLFFEQFTYRIGTREFVMYNPRDEHYMTSHAIDLLELTPEQLALDRSRGHYAVHDAPHPHWKYFWFD